MIKAEPDAIASALRAIGAAEGTTLAIGEAALLLAAHERADVDLAPYRRHLADLATEGAQARGRDVMATVAAVSSLLFDRLGYQGDGETYDDLRNADLPHVIDRRRGLPVALGILMIHTARAAGLRAYGVNTPGHFLVEVGGGPGGHGRAICDPFHGGRVLGAAGLRDLFGTESGIADGVAAGAFPPMADRDVLVRLQNNIRGRALGAGDRDRAIRALETMAMIAPAAISTWRELAGLYADAGHLRAAMAAMEKTGAAGREALDELRRRLN